MINVMFCRSDSSSPLQLLSEAADANWCRHCDVRHDDVKNDDDVDANDDKVDACPVKKPVLLVTDAVIDFSASKDSKDRYTTTTATVTAVTTTTTTTVTKSVTAANII